MNDTNIDKLDNKNTEDSKKIILVAEDKDSNYLLLEAILRGKAKLIRAMNGVEAVEIAKKGGIDMILMDTMMPEMDGLEATKIIRTFDMEIPIITVTANAYDSDKQKAMDAGSNGYVTKPIKRQELFEAIFGE